MLDAARAEMERKHNRDADDRTQTRQGDIVFVKNETDRKLPRNSVLGLNGPIFSPSDSLDSFIRQVAFRGVVPTADHEGRFAILLDPAAPGRIARAWVSGVCPVQVDVVDESHKCADVAAGNTTSLVTSESGSAQIVYRQGEGGGTGLVYDGGAYDTGEQWAYVRIGSTCGGSDDGTTSRQARCDCPGAASDYLVEVECGSCGAYYSGGTTMPRFWWIEVTSADEPGYGAYGYDDCSVPCGQLFGMKIKLENESAGATEYYDEVPSCTWTGKGSSCVEAELTAIGEFWQVTLMDREGCLLAILRKPIGEFACCGDNTGWTLDPSSGCDIAITLSPDPCTCCPGPPVCPPEGEVVCKGTACCLESCNCLITVTVSNLATPAGLACTEFDLDCTTPDGTPCNFPEPDCWKDLPEANEACGGMNGNYPMTWAGDCMWLFEGVPSAPGSTETHARLILAGNLWQFRIEGDDGQVALFESVNWECEHNIVLELVGGTCDPTSPVPTAVINLCLNVN